MSYTTQIKNEISKLYNTKSEMIAELSAFVRNNGNIVDNSIYLTTENEIILNRLVEFITALYDIHPKTDSKANLNFSKNRLNVLVIVFINYKSFDYKKYTLKKCQFLFIIYEYIHKKK